MCNYCLLKEKSAFFSSNLLTFHYNGARNLKFIYYSNIHQYRKGSQPFHIERERKNSSDFTCFVYFWKQKYKLDFRHSSVILHLDLT